MLTWKTDFIQHTRKLRFRLFKNSQAMGNFLKYLDRPRFPQYRQATEITQNRDAGGVPQFEFLSFFGDYARSLENLYIWDMITLKTVIKVKSKILKKQQLAIINKDNKRLF